MTYQINIESTGLANNEQVEFMADTLRANGYDVQATRQFGNINLGVDAMFEGGRALADWETALIAADKA